jgi:hypothetical protein
MQSGQGRERKALLSSVSGGAIAVFFNKGFYTFGDGAGQIVAAISGLTELPPGAIQKLSRQPAPAGT